MKEFAIAQSSRASCKFCKKKIEKGSKKVACFSFASGYTQENSICCKCGKEELRAQIEGLTEILKKLEE